MTQTTPACISDENVADIVETAGLGGINYWASRALVHTDDNDTVTGYDVTEFDDTVGGGTTHTLSAADIRAAVWTIFAGNVDGPHDGSAVRGYIFEAIRRADDDGLDCGMIDADAADVIIQVACFNKVIYG